VNTTQQQVKVVDEDDVTITTVTLQLPHTVADYQSPVKSVLRCPAIRIHLNGSTTAAPVLAQSGAVAVQAPASSVLPRVTESCQFDTRSQQSQPQQQAASCSTTASDSYSTFNGRTVRHLPANGFSIDDRATSVTIFISSLRY